MPAEMSVDLKQHIIDWYLVDQYTYGQIASLADCSIGNVLNVMRNFCEFGQVKTPSAFILAVHLRLKETLCIYMLC